MSDFNNYNNYNNDSSNYSSYVDNYDDSFNNGSQSGFGMGETTSYYFQSLVDTLFLKL